MQRRLFPHRIYRFVAAIVTMTLIAISIIAFGILLALPTPSARDVIASAGVLEDSVKVYRNDFGIAHIIADTDEDVFVALGYIHASDRLWQMDLYRRIARGRLAEIFGKSFVRTDAFFRTLSLGHIAERTLWPALSEESKRILRAYARGVNLFISQHQRQLPFEFGALGYTPDPWQETDCLAIGRLMAFDLSMSFWTDLVLGEIADRFGVELALRLVPYQENTAPDVLDQSRNRTFSIGAVDGVGRDSRIGAIIHKLSSFYAEARQVIGWDALGSGSNSWAVRLQQATPPDAILANDPHLQLALPPRWYPVHLTSPSFNVIGMTVPGLPVVLAGRNDAIAWGVTNVMLDDCDYFLEQQDTAAPHRVIVGTKSIRLTIRQDTIRVRGMAPTTIWVRSIGHRPILSDVHIAEEADTLIGFPPQRSGTPLTRRYVISVAWTGYSVSDEIRAMLHIMRARSWTQFQAALRWWGTPALNFTFADVAGNIGIQPAGIVPKRGSGHPNLPLPGWDTAYAWRGVVYSPFPAIFNPPRGYVFSANNRLADSLPFFVSNLWEPSSRAERIEQILALGGTYTVRDAQLMQLDLGSPYAMQLRKLVMPVLERTSFDSATTRAFTIFRQWNGYLLPASAGAAIYSVFLERLMNVTFRARLPEDVYQRYAFIASMPLRRLPQILAQPTEWFAADSATAVRLRDRAIVQAFTEAVQRLTQQYPVSPKQWRWSDLHTLHLKHPLASVRAYRSLLTRSPGQLGGDATTIANGYWRIHQPFDMTIGASMRLVTRLRDTVVYAVVPGGVSGNPLSSNFSDQLTLWENGGLLALPLAPYPHPTWQLATVLIPSRDIRPVSLRQGFSRTSGLYTR